MTDARTRHTRGLIVVILLGVIFFALLALIILKTGGPSSLMAGSESVTVLPMRIRIRTEPNARAPVVATATTGETLRLVEDQGTWVRVEKNDGLAGWAERENLERTVERERRLARYKAIRSLPSLTGITSTRTQLFSGPGIFYPLIGELPAGTTVKLFTRDHDFFVVDFNSEVAYADVDTIDVSASGAPQFEVQTASTGTGEPAATIRPVPAETVEPPPEPEIPALFPAGDLVDRGGVYSAVPPGGTQPEEIDRVVPRYPAGARREGVSGAVVIRGIVRRDGTIDDVEIIKDLPYGLGESARDAVRRWRFRPATYRGEPIDVYYTVTVNFRMQ